MLLKLFIAFVCLHMASCGAYLSMKFRCHEEFCKSIICETISNCSVEHNVPNSSYCNCCSTCINNLGLGDECPTNIDGSFRDLKSPRCKKGLKCIEGKCKEEICNNNCFSQKKIFEFRLKEEGSVYADDLWIPECETDGSFKAKQQRKDRIICADKAGNKIFGSEEEQMKENVTCGCSRYMLELENTLGQLFMTYPQEHCSENGNFDILQCIGSLCYCADPITGEVKGRLTRIPYRDKLPCYINRQLRQEYLKSCEKELQRIRYLMYRLHQKGVKVIGLERVRCDPDGTFSPKQCDSIKCDCTDINGIRIKSFFKDYDHLAAEKVQMLCNCARRSESATYTNLPALNCDPYGNFRVFHCFTDQKCFCIHPDGDIISKSFDDSKVNQTFCKEILQELYELPETPTTSTESTNGFSDDDYDY